MSARVTDAFENPVGGAVVELSASAGKAPALRDVGRRRRRDDHRLDTRHDRGTECAHVAFRHGDVVVHRHRASRRSGAAHGRRHDAAVGARRRAPRSGAAATRRQVRKFRSGAAAHVRRHRRRWVARVDDCPSDADGTVVLSGWTLGRTALPQVVHATSATSRRTLSADVTAVVQSDFHIDVRFFGPGMTDDQKALFTNAAARISAVIVGSIPDVTYSDLSVSSACGFPGLPTVDETIHSIVIFASVMPIDGPGGILAGSGPCLLRNPPGFLPSIGAMLFDSDDLAQMASDGILQDVITHEMLHAVGFGTIWDAKDLLLGGGTVNSAFAGTKARQGCLGDGGGDDLRQLGSGGERHDPRHRRRALARIDLRSRADDRLRESRPDAAQRDHRRQPRGPRLHGEPARGRSVRRADAARSTTSFPRQRRRGRSGSSQKSRPREFAGSSGGAGRAAGRSARPYDSRSS